MQLENMNNRSEWIVGHLGTRIKYITRLYIITERIMVGECGTRLNVVLQKAVAKA